VAVVEPLLELLSSADYNDEERSTKSHETTPKPNITKKPLVLFRVI